MTTEITPRLRWEPGEDGILFGYCGTLKHWAFAIVPPGSPGEFWMISTPFPLGQPRYVGSKKEARDAAERWLGEFTASLGAVWPDERDEFEFPRDGLDLEAAFSPGAYVRYQHPDDGWEDDQAAGRKLLTHGRLYRVAWNDIGQSKTRIGLVGIKGVTFNSVLFEPVAVEDVTDAEAAEVARRNGIRSVAPVAGEE